MTTIAATTATMAADTQLTGDYTMRVQKIVRLPDGGVAGGCGDWAHAYAGLKWLAEGEEGDPPRLKGATLLILRPEGTLWIAEGRFPAYPLLDKTAAIGCGGQAAMVAMAKGATPVQAIKEVCNLDAYTGDQVQVLSIESPPKKRRRNRGG